ncbi:spore germination lipoprotein GerD [Lederbergia sp. NSJ-179]|uniref:spore germination lipoprotein GerD n=1 Tax=Lederbergia sp. NSJ-179 TaxID=2931402 RepID=UPI001FD36EAD|nr:spore germination lipoprotein GerD [Lederbergia sp. NSJ-179]MCJ7839945.1 spore germination lipoprotein GerD [Lederbergia sp. NSJ-179]
MKKAVFPLLLMIIVIMLSSCGRADGENETLDYDQTKKMIVDILKTDDGKKAIQEIISDADIKQQLIMNDDTVKNSIEQALTSEKAEDFWKRSFQDPNFAKTVAKSMRTEHEALLKDLMKDPQYQQLFIDILKDPELQKEYTTAVKSREFREHLQKVISETLNSPLYKAQIQDLLLKAAKETGSKSDKGNKEDQGGGGGGESGTDQGP